MSHSFVFLHWLSMTQEGEAERNGCFSSPRPPRAAQRNKIKSSVDLHNEVSASFAVNIR